MVPPDGYLLYDNTHLLSLFVDISSPTAYSVLSFFMRITGTAPASAQVTGIPRLYKVSFLAHVNHIVLCVSGGECTVGPGDLTLQCPNCKSYNCAPVLSERYGPFNKVKVVCADCGHRWEMMVLIT